MFQVHHTKYLWDVYRPTSVANPIGEYSGRSVQSQSGRECDAVKAEHRTIQNLQNFHLHSPFFNGEHTLYLNGWGQPWKAFKYSPAIVLMCWAFHAFKNYFHSLVNKTCTKQNILLCHITKRFSKTLSIVFLETFLTSNLLYFVFKGLWRMTNIVLSSSKQPKCQT